MYSLEFITHIMYTIFRAASTNGALYLYVIDFNHVRDSCNLQPIFILSFDSTNVQIRASFLTYCFYLFFEYVSVF